MTPLDGKLFSRFCKRFGISDKYLITKFLCLIVVYENNMCAGHAALFIGSNRDTCFIGFFEYDTESVGLALLDCAVDYCRPLAFKRLVGPIDGDIWSGYRCKVSGFDKKFLFESKYGYDTASLLTDFGFRICNTWSTYNIEFPLPVKNVLKLDSRYQQFCIEGYIFEEINFLNFHQQLRSVYNILMSSFASFDEFSSISYSDFVAKFAKLRWMVDKHVAYVAYDSSYAPVGFIFAVPNYALCTGIFSKLGMKFFPSEYIVQCLCVKHGHEGLGSAFSHILYEHQCKTGSSAVAAMIRDGTISSSYIGKNKVLLAQYCLYEYGIR